MTDPFDVDGRIRDRLRRADLPAAPAALHDRLAEIASRAAPAPASGVVAMPRRATRPGLLLAAAFVAVAILGVLGVGGRLVLFEARPSPSGSDAPGPTTAEGSPPPLGPIVDGVPTTIDGRPVLRGEALRSALAATTDDAPILAGGWFHDQRPAPVFCPLILRPAPRLDLCANGFELFDGALGLRLTKIAAGDLDRSATFALSHEALRPVVLEVGTHDPECTPDVDKAMACLHTPVLRAVPWLGDTPTPRPSASPMPTPPGTPLSRAEAVALAAGRVAGGALVCAVPALHSAAFGVLDPQGDDPWIWVVVFTLGPDRSALVALDYRTGAFIHSDTGSGARTCP